MDPVQALWDSWDEGEEASYPQSRRVPASEADIAAFEAAHDVVLPELARAFYRRVNGMTLAEWALDTNHFCVKFFSLQQVSPVECPSEAPGGVPQRGRYFAIAAIGHWDPGPEGYALVYAMELTKDRTAHTPVRGVYTGRTSFPVAGSLEEFFSIAATRVMDDPILNPEWERHLESLREKYAGAGARRPKKRGWQFWKPRPTR
jgi:hypothetical protein